MGIWWREGGTALLAYGHARRCVRAGISVYFMVLWVGVAHIVASVLYLYRSNHVGSQVKAT